jgi:hypothetical protein
MGCDPLKQIDGNELDINVALFGQLQLLLLLNNNEKNDYIEGFEYCTQLVEKWSKQSNLPKIIDN